MRRALRSLRRALDRAPVRGDLGTTRSGASLLLILFLVALAPRLEFVLEEHPPGLYLVGDMALYRERAVRMLDGPQDLWDTFTPPGYPALIALLFATMGRHDEIVAWAQAMLGAVTVVMAFALARRVTRSTVASLVVFSVLTFYTPLIFYSGFFLSETVFAFLITLFVVACVEALEREDTASTVASLVAGFALGLGAAARPNLLVAFPLLATVAVAVRHAPRVRATALVTAITATVVVAAFSLRGSWLAHRPVTLATNGGVNFYLAHADVGGVRFPEGDAIREIRTYQSRMRSTPVEEVTLHAYDDAAFYRRGLAALCESPRSVPRAFGALADGLGLGPIGGHENPPYWPGWNGHDGVLGAWLRAMVALGTIPALVHAAWLARRGELVRREEIPRLLVLALFGSVMVTMLVFLGNPRVRVPFDPLVIVLAAGAYTDIARTCAERFALRSRRST